jgi:hypothetical protein
MAGYVYGIDPTDAELLYDEQLFDSGTRDLLGHEDHLFGTTPAAAFEVTLD